MGNINERQKRKITHSVSIAVKKFSDWHKKSYPISSLSISEGYEKHLSDFVSEELEKWFSESHYRGLDKTKINKIGYITEKMRSQATMGIDCAVIHESSINGFNVSVYVLEE